MNQTQQPLKDPVLKELKDSLDNLCDISRRYDGIEKTITEGIRAICEKILDDRDISISVKIDHFDSVLDRELMDIKVTMSLYSGRDHFTLMSVDKIINISKALHYNNPRVCAENGDLVLYFGCRELSVSLGGSSEQWDYEDEK